MNKVLDFDEEHYSECDVCRDLFIIKQLILDLDFSSMNLHEIRDFVDGLIQGDKYD